ncbi:leucyl aminopeptidase [Francisellaceae bacterium]|nr:leucyl aminopeptidase [Francisellaceae bacterium]
MELNIKSGHPEKQRTACLVIGVFEGRKLSSSGVEVDKASNGHLSRILRRGDIEGKTGQMLLLFDVKGTLSDRVLLVGCGKEKDFTNCVYKEIIAKMVHQLNETGSMDAVCYLTQLHVKNNTTYDNIRSATEASLNSLYKFDSFKSNDSEVRRPLRKLTLCVATRADLHTGEDALKHGSAISAGMTCSKDLMNTPANVCTPAFLKDKAIKISEACSRTTVEVLNEHEMEKLGMNCLLAVGKGSENRPYLVSIQYNGGKENQKPVVLVGKGVTFDTGGICIKPRAGMETMKMDMGGAAGVLGIMQTIIELQLPINVVGTVAALENSVDGLAYRPGDVLKSMQGTTVEVLNTDAEGRLALCDALTYIAKFNPETVIDMATLTGAIIIALGSEYSGVFGNHNPLINDLLSAGKASADLGWHMPIADAYTKSLKSNVADLGNIAGSPDAGSGTAAAFLAEFAKKYRWAHLDVAGSAMGGLTGAKASGRPVPMVTQYLMDLCSSES